MEEQDLEWDPDKASRQTSASGAPGQRKYRNTGKGKPFELRHLVTILVTKITQRTVIQ
jgi:hypothetical protein